MANARERKAWALDVAATLLHTDLDCMALDEFDEVEADKRRDAIREIANSLRRRAEKMEVTSDHSI